MGVNRTEPAMTAEASQDTKTNKTKKKNKTTKALARNKKSSQKRRRHARDYRGSWEVPIRNASIDRAA